MQQAPSFFCKPNEFDNADLFYDYDAESQLVITECLDSRFVLIARKSRMIIDANSLFGLQRDNTVHLAGCHEIFQMILYSLALMVILRTLVNLETRRKKLE